MIKNIYLAPVRPTITPQQTTIIQHVFQNISVYRTRFLIIVILLSLINAIIIDAMFIFPIGWLLSVILPAAIERVPDLINKIRSLFGFNPPQDNGYDRRNRQKR